jgi:hypothetical protein
MTMISTDFRRNSFRRNSLLGFALLALWGALVGVRFQWSSDPRGAERLRVLDRQRESDQFKERLRRGAKEDLPWPGLKAAQVSWTWLNLLNGIHQEASYQGDFSWVFSKLFTVSQYANEKELFFLSTLAPFYFVIGKDHAGATLFLHELYRRNPNSYNTLFWGGFHAIDNLHIRSMAAYFYERAARSPEAPHYLASLALRLRYGEELFSNASLRKEVLESHVSPELRAHLQKIRPNWFE